MLHRTYSSLWLYHSSWKIHFGSRKMHWISWFCFEDMTISLSDVKKERIRLCSEIQIGEFPTIRTTAKLYENETFIKVKRTLIRE